MPNTFRQYAAKTYALEKIFVPKLIRITKRFRADFIATLQSEGKNAAIGNLQQQLPPDELIKAVQDIYKRAGLTGARITFNELKAAVRQIEQKAGFGRNEQWIANVLEYLRLHLLAFVQDITETMRSDIVKILERGIDQGMSIDQIVNELKSEGLIRSRARVIARTEVNRATNVGHAVGAQSLPYEVDKKWSAANDHRTRHSHRLVHDHRVDETDTFKVPIYKGDKPTGLFEEMLYPGDATASAANTVNCRCRVVYLPKRDADGRLIMRNRNQAIVIPMRSPTSYTPAQIAAQLKANIHIGVEEK
jgi:uncharacterized protein with gpF-like domain